MLFNPEWKHDFSKVSLDDFIGWLETQNPNTSYNFRNNKGECLCGQYMAARGIKWDLTDYQGSSTYAKTINKLFGDHPADIGFVFNPCRGERVLAAYPQTIGGALERAKKFREQAQMEKVDA